MYQGSCSCGKVQYEIAGISDIVYCHCSLCRKAQGSAFATNGLVKEQELEFIKGEDNLTEYQSNENKSVFFCCTCGSPIYSKMKNIPKVVRIRVGTISSNIKERPIAHIFATSKAQWEQITDDLPQFEQYIE